VTDPPKFADAYAEVLAGVLSPEMVRRVFDAIFAGDWAPTQIAAFIAALRVRGETAPIIATAARALRSAMVRVEHGLPRVVDTCGTGGDGLGTLNLSTGAAIIVAAANLPVAKHGNRAQSSKTGSADVLEALGVPIDLPAEASAVVLREAGIAFLLAPVHHPAMRHAAVARRELGVRTIFNLLGPLANPAGATHQLVGAPEEALRPVLAATLAELGTASAWVVRGAEGLDEMSPSGPTRISVVKDGRVTETQVVPEDFGLDRIPLEALAGGAPPENARVLEQVLEGSPHPSRNGFLLNAAAALALAEGLRPKDAAEKARSLVDSGQAHGVLERWRRIASASRKSAPPPDAR